ncbi:MAG: chromosome segregation protein SMC [Vulcanimicrobiota bacterium]
MFVKNLEIVGFKSFADKVRLEFSPGINTVVGPNGCGKSNIIDAFRWVLGEQKFSKLRSKNTSEVIFVGTKKRKPAGLAQISITFDNEDGKIPLDTPQVSFARRVYSDGGGQYLINGRNARLKDVHELIADTGIGSGALFVLSNQEIDRILSNDSQERRSILEETAGINKYQLRKKETLRKLDATNTNITRLNDILQEVGRQLEFSKKQLRKYQRYQKIKIKLQKLEVELILKNIQDIEVEQNQLDARLEELEQKRTEVNGVLESLKYEINSAESDRNRCHIELEGIKEKYQQVSLEQEKLRGDSRLIRQGIEQSRKSLEEYERNRAQFKERIEKINMRIEEGQNRKKCLAGEKTELETRFEEARQKLEKKQLDYRSVTEKIQVLKAQLSEIEHKLQLQQIQKENYSRQFNALDNQKKNREEKLVKISSELSQAKEKIDAWKEKLTGISQKKQDKENNLAKFKNLLEQLGEEQAEKQLRYQKLKEVIYSEQSEIGVLIREEEDFRGFSGAFRLLMKHKNQLPELVPVYSVIKISSEYDNAIDVALGAHFQSVITENRHDANLCVNFLKKERAGRLTFFPLDMDRKAQTLPHLPPGLPGIVGWARNLIETDSRYRDIIDHICGTTLVVKDLDSAYYIYDQQRKSRGYIPKMITLDGDVVEYSGAVTGGRYRVDRSQILSRTRRREELENQLPDKIQRAQKLKQNIDTLARTLTEKHNKSKNLAGELLTLEKEERNLEGQLKIYSDLTSRGEEDRLLSARELDETGERMAELKAGMDELAGNIDDYNDDIKKRQKELERIEVENSSAMEELENLENILENLKKEKSSLKSMETTLEAQLRNDRDHLDEYRQDFEGIENEILSRQKELDKKEKELREVLNKESVLKLKYNSLKLALETSQKETLSYDEKLAGLKNRLIEQETRRSRLGELINKSSIEKIEIKSRLNYKNERLKEFPEDIRSSVGKINENSIELDEAIEKTRKTLANFDSINFSAQEEYEEHKQRYDFLSSQIEDLKEAGQGLRDIIRDMDRVSLKALEETLEKLNIHFQKLFTKVFRGGTASVFFTEPENKLESGIDVQVQPPGKRTTNMGLLSTGEKSLTAVTFLFALLSIKPGPFILLDELDAPLDESNVEKIAELIREFSENSQFVVVTHNKKTMEYADTLMGITMEEPGVSRVVSVKFEDVNEFTDSREPAKI